MSDTSMDPMNPTLDEALARARERGHESRDAHVWSVALVGLGLVVLLVVCLLAVRWLVIAWSDALPTTAGQQPAPRELETQTYQESFRRHQQAEQRRLLHRYGWIDRNQGIARIPIERAMEVLAERNELTFPANQPPQTKAKPDSDE